MSQLLDTGRPLPPRGGRGSTDASISLTSFNGLGAASSAFGNEPHELLGIAAGPAPMSITSSVPRTLSNSTGPGQQIYAGNISEYDFPHDLDLTDPQGSRQTCCRYQVTDDNDGTFAHPLQRLASAEPEHMPWSGMHLDGVLPSAPQREPAEQSFSNSNNIRIGQRRSMTGSHANVTDEGYYTHSQPDLRSMYSGDSSQMHHVRPGQSSIPRTLPSTQGQPGFDQCNANQFPKPMDYQVAQPTDQQGSSGDHQESLQCIEADCSFTCRTMSDWKKHIARHERRHVCDQPGCTREKGFATINDLQRHQKTVHHITPTHGASRMYKCFSRNCKHPDKEWPRLDNFKQHLKKMHKSEITEELVRKSDEWYDRERRASQAASALVREAISPDSLRRISSSNQPHEALSPVQQSPNHLSPGWRPTASATRSQLVRNAGRPRHSSFSSHPKSSAPSSQMSVPSIRQFQNYDISSGVGHQTGQASFSVNPTQLSPDALSSSLHRLPHGRFTSAYTVPNPDTSTLSDLPDMSFSPQSESFPATQNDFAQIASRFSSEQQPNLPAADPDSHSPSSPTNEARRSSTPFQFSIKAIRALIDRCPSGHKSENAVFLERVWRAGIEKLTESSNRSTTATTTSPSPSVITSTHSPQPDPTDIRQPHRCSEQPCTKSYPRLCDLRKHLKRHHRPYGCTFSKCYDNFGSKYDWKRHENSQHFQQECWKCGLCFHTAAANGQSSTLPSSAQLFYKRKHYVDHLRDVHLASVETIKEHVDKQRIGRNCQTRFWCGFCAEIIALKKKGLEGADERFNHIDKHFRDGRRISSWLDVEESVAKGLMQQAQEEEEDVLGDDGIGSGDNDDEDPPEDSSSDPDDYTGAGGIGAEARAGQKRAHPSDFESLRPTHRRRIDTAREKSPSTTLVQCCRECGNGPWVLRQGAICVICNHRCCKSCKYSRIPDESC